MEQGIVICNGFQPVNRFSCVSPGDLIQLPTSSFFSFKGAQLVLHKLSMFSILQNSVRTYLTNKKKKLITRKIKSNIRVAYDKPNLCRYIEVDFRINSAVILPLAH